MSWSIFRQSQISPKSFAESILHAIGAPTTNQNVQSLIAWMVLEGGGGQYNPLNTTVGQGSLLPGNSSGVKEFSSIPDGIKYTAQTLEQSNFSQILSMLKSGNGIQPTPELLSWSGNGYNSVQGGWSQAAQYMGGSGNIVLTSGPGGSAPQPSGGSGGGTGQMPELYNPVMSPLEHIPWLGPLIKGFFQDTAGTIVGVGTTIGDVATGIGGIVDAMSKFMKWISWLFVPAHWLRIGAFIAGIGFMAGGIYMFKEAL